MAGATTTPSHASSNLAGSVFLITSDGRTLSLPIPSRSRRDPLNWSRKKRAGALFSLAFFAICGLTIVQAPTLILGPLAREFAGTNLSTFCPEWLVLAPTLTMGLGAFLWIPLSLAIGRRSVLLISSLILIGSTVWAALAQSFGHMVAAVLLQAFANSVTTSALLLMVIDLTFIHQRLQAVAMVWSLAGVVAFLILSLLPQMTVGGTKWRLFYDAWILVSLISFILCFCLFPETYFLRPAVAFDGRILLQGSGEKIEIYPDWETAPVEKELPDTPSAGWKIWLRERKFGAVTEGGWKAMRHCYLQIFLCLINPTILWVTLLNSLVFGAMVSICATYSRVLSSEPYNLKIEIISLVNISAALGAFLAWPASGVVIAKVTRKLAMCNNGVREAEHLILAFVLPVFASITSLIMYGITADRKLHFMLIYASFSLSSFGFICLSTANTIWVTEAFPRHAAAALAVVVGGTYMASFGLKLAIEPWVASQGLIGADIQLAVLTLGVGLLGIPISVYGKKARLSITGRWADHQGGALRPQ